MDPDGILSTSGGGTLQSQKPSWTNDARHSSVPSDVLHVIAGENLLLSERRVTRNTYMSKSHREMSSRGMHVLFLFSRNCHIAISSADASSSLKYTFDAECGCTYRSMRTRRVMDIRTSNVPAHESPRDGATDARTDDAARFLAKRPHMPSRTARVVEEDLEEPDPARAQSSC